MKCFLRILAFLFIGFSSLYGDTLEKARESANQSIASAIAFEKKGVLFSNLGCSSKGCFIKIDNTVYSVPSQPDICIGTSGNYGCYSNKTELTYYVEWNGCLYKPCYFSHSSPDPNPCEYSPTYCEIIGTAPYYNSSSFKASPVCSLKEGEYFSSITGFCVEPCPEGSYYNSFSEECTTSCEHVSNINNRFDCLCKEKGLGGHKSHDTSKSIVIVNSSSGGGSYDKYDGTIYCEGGNLGSADISDYLNNKGYESKDLEELTSDFFSTSDVLHGDKNNQSGSSDGTSSGDSGGGEQGSTEPMTPEQQQQEQEKNECKAIVASITANFRAYIQKYVNNGVDCSDSNAVQSARDAKSTIEMKVQTYNQSKCATAYHRIDVTVPVHSCKTDPTKPDPIEPPAPQNPSDSIKYDENTNSVTITDSAGNTQSVTPTDVTKNDKGELQTIKYTDPETGKTIEYKVKEDGTWERVEYPGQGTGTGTNPSDKESGTGQGDGKPGGSSEGEGAGDSENGKDDGNKDGEGNFEGGEFGALGNANDFDEGGLLSGLNDELDSLAEENIGLLEGIIENISSYIDDLKQSIDNLKDKADALKSNPFSSSKITSCPTDFSLLDQSIRIDLCEHTSKFSNLFYAIFYLALNVFIAFGMFRLFVLILVSI